MQVCLQCQWAPAPVCVVVALGRWEREEELQHSPQPSEKLSLLQKWRDPILVLPAHWWGLEREGPMCGCAVSIICLPDPGNCRMPGLLTFSLPLTPRSQVASPIWLAVGPWTDPSLVYHWRSHFIQPTLLPTGLRGEEWLWVGAEGD